MEIRTLSGDAVTRLHEEELGCMVESGTSIGDLKKLLAGRIGYSRFRQRLLSDDIGELQDNMPVRKLTSVQLVILDFCAPEETVWEKLLFACENNLVVEVATLLQTPLNPNGRGADSDTPPVYIAAERGNLTVVRLLLEAGADVNAAKADGATALMVAAFNGHSEVVRLLLEAGADKNAAREDGVTALMAAPVAGHLEVVRLLLEAQADKNAAREDGSTALFVAAQSGHLEMVQLLLEAEADKNATRANGPTALIVAAEDGHLEMVRMLLEAGADKNAAQADGATALFVAAFNGHMEVVQLLLDAGADKNVARAERQQLCLLQLRMATWKLCGCCSRLELTRMQH